MATARDHVEAYNFAVRRQVLALLNGEDAVTTDPRRRLNRSLIGGLLLAVVVLAAVGVAGFLSGGSSSSVPSEGVIIDSDSGGAYVRIGDVLHPALNIASARLVAGKDATTVSSDALRSLPRGLPVGIPDAPDSLPPAARLTDAGWSVCTIAPEANAARAQIVVSVGAPAPTPLPPGAGVVVQTPDDKAWLLDGGMRYAVSDAASTLLGLDSVLPMKITPQVLDLVPEGPPLDIPQVPGAGQAPSRSLPFDAVVGDLVQVDNGTKQPGLYVVLQDGVAPVDSFAYLLLGGNARQTLTEPASDIVSVPAKTRPAIPALWPRAAFGRPVAAPSTNEPLCISYDPSAPSGPAAWPVAFSEPPTVPLAAHATPVAASAGSLPTVATGVAVPSGGGVLVKAAATGGVDAVYTLVTDSGLRFSISNADAVSRLGYSTSAAVSVPLPFVNLLPAGPGLDPAAAAAEYAGAAQAPAATASGSVPASGSAAPSSN